MTAFIYPLSVAVPVSLTEQANHLAAYLGNTPNDLQTYIAARYTDGTTDYHYLATVVTAMALQKVAAPADLPEYVDAQKLSDALAALSMTHYTGEEALPAAQADKITAYIGAGCEVAITAMGLTLKPESEDE